MIVYDVRPVKLSKLTKQEIKDLVERLQGVEPHADDHAKVIIKQQLNKILKHVTSDLETQQAKEPVTLDTPPTLKPLDFKKFDDGEIE